MFKVVGLFKRKPGMSFEEFKDYYENVHAHLGTPVFGAGGVQYMRRYLTPIPNPLTGEAAESDCDVIMEMWFKDKDHFEQTVGALQEPELARRIAEDEPKLFDVGKIRMFFDEEHVSA